MASLEKILAYHSLKAFLSKEEWQALGQKMGMDAESMRRTWGKNVEGAFFLIALTYKMVEHILPFNEGFAKLSGTPSPDGIIIFHDGTKILVEVKATEEEIWKMSKGRFQKQKDLAAQLGINLYFAIFLKNHWGLFTADYVAANNYRIDFPRDLKSSVFESVFDSYLIRIPKGLKITKYYSPHEKDNDLVGIEEPGHGYLYQYELRYENKLVSLSKELTLIGISAVENAVFANARVEKMAGDVTVVTHECPEDLLVNDFDLVMAPIHKTKSSVTNDYFDTSSFITHTLDMLQSSGTLGLLKAKEDMLNFLNNLRGNGIPFDLLKISQIDDLKYGL